MTVRASRPGLPPNDAVRCEALALGEVGELALVGQEAHVAADAAAAAEPARHRPESGMKPKRSTTIGWVASCASTGMFEALNAHDIASQPSRPARAPVPESTSS